MDNQCEERCKIMDQIQTDKVETIVSSYTYEQQREIFVEECAEAIQAVQKVKRAAEISAERYTKVTDELVSEVADVLIMAQQMRLYLGSEKVDTAINYKLDRQISRIMEGNENG